MSKEGGGSEPHPTLRPDPGALKSGHHLDVSPSKYVAGRRFSPPPGRLDLGLSGRVLGVYSGDPVRDLISTRTPPFLILGGKLVN
jgi:hypothetical protein